MKRLVTSICLLATFIVKAEPPFVPKPVQEHYSLLVNAFQKEKWKHVVYEGRFITTNHPYSPFTPETYYYLAQAFYTTGKYQKANRYFTDYLKADMTPRYFEEAINTKFDIGKRLEKGKPETAVEIYTEISTALPRSDMAAECLFRKGEVLGRIEDFKESVEAYQSAIRRFPKSPFAPESYIGIANVYLKQVSKEFPDPDLLNLAQINIEQFSLSFPSEPRVESIRLIYRNMREEFAKELYVIGDFYKRTKKYSAAKIYFDSLLEQYPDTSYAKKSAKCLEKIAKKLPKEELASSSNK